jgi:prepilin-type N-terminal cleavage/methylation domain-containing protein
MTRRRGFTLIEVLVAIVVTGAVALLAYGSLQAGFDTNERLSRHHETFEADAKFRALVSDALRHPVEPTAIDEMLLALVDAVDSSGTPSDRLRFLSNGIVTPLGTSPPWEVTVGPGREGIEFLARPLDGTAGATIRATLRSARGLDVHVLSRHNDAAWDTQWSSGGRMPAAIELSFTPANGLPRGAPLVVRVGLEVAP